MIRSTSATTTAAIVAVAALGGTAAGQQQQQQQQPQPQTQPQLHGQPTTAQPTGRYGDVQWDGQQTGRQIAPGTPRATDVRTVAPGQQPPMTGRDARSPADQRQLTGAQRRAPGRGPDAGTGVDVGTQDPVPVPGTQADQGIIGGRMDVGGGLQTDYRSPGSGRVPPGAGDPSLGARERMRAWRGEPTGQQPQPQQPTVWTRDERTHGAWGDRIDTRTYGNFHWDEVVGPEQRVDEPLRPRGQQQPQQRPQQPRGGGGGGAAGGD
jgi:hypothetical protein